MKENDNHVTGHAEDGREDQEPQYACCRETLEFRVFPRLTRSAFLSKSFRDPHRTTGLKVHGSTSTNKSVAVLSFTEAAHCSHRLPRADMALSESNCYKAYDREYRYETELSFREKTPHAQCVRWCSPDLRHICSWRACRVWVWSPGRELTLAHRPRPTYRGHPPGWIAEPDEVT